MTRSAFLAFSLLLLAAVPAAAKAAEPFRQDVELKDHVFAPSEIIVPAGQPVELHIKNLDATAEEFDSSALKVEKVIAGKGEGVVHIHPLAPGRYPFMGEYHEKTAHGVVIAH